MHQSPCGAKQRHDGTEYLLTQKGEEISLPPRPALRLIGKWSPAAYVEGLTRPERKDLLVFTQSDVER